MKRLLPTIPIILFLLLNACGAVPDPSSKVPGNWTEIVQSLTATVWTPVPTQTYNPNIPNIIYALNADISASRSLEQRLDVEYKIDDINFPFIPNRTDQFFRLKVRCRCVKDDDCCHPERTFVMVVEILQKQRGIVYLNVSSNVGYLLVECWDSKTEAPIGALKAPWRDVRAYLDGLITGYQLGDLSVRYTAP